MTTYEKMDLSPVETADLLIKEINTLLSNCGVITIYGAANNKSSDTEKGLAENIYRYLQTQSISKLIPQYDNLISLVGDFVATIDSESDFKEVAFPELPEIGYDNKVNVKNIIQYIVISKKLIQPLIDDAEGYKKKHQFLSIIESKKKDQNKGFFYEFTDGDLDRSQELINELRNEISGSELFEPEHKQRLLKRLEKVQSELHKKMSDVDRIWGLVGDAGIVIGKLGKDSKPIVDRIKELSQIAWRTQSHTEELPSGSNNPLLGSDADNQNEA